MNGVVPENGMGKDEIVALQAVKGGTSSTLILKRLVTVFIFVCTLLAGVVARLCAPDLIWEQISNETSAVSHSPLPRARTL